MNQFGTDPDGAGGLQDLDGDGKYDDLEPGGSFLIENIQSQIIACENLTSSADVSYGCGGACYDTAIDGGTSSGSIAVTIADPDISVSFDSDGKLDGIDYCTGEQGVEIIITNVAGAGQATEFSLDVDTIPAGYNITNVAATG